MFKQVVEKREPSKQMRLTSSSFLEYSDAVLDRKEDFEKIKEYVGNKEELLFDDATEVLQKVIDSRKEMAA